MLGEEIVQHYLEILNMGVVVHFILFLICILLLTYKFSKCHEDSIEQFPYPLANVISLGIGIFIEFFVYCEVYTKVYKIKEFGYHTPLYFISIIALVIAMIIFVNGLHFLYRIILWKETKEENEKERVEIC